ncbi:MAG: 2-oxo acid dehydrogenase subunit E2 [Acidobacteria bacterium]|nr:2-oxo acid dehydrogenase subunit E2 [Acidobacteriota bacterium]
MAAPAAALVDVLAPVEQEGTKASVKTWLKQLGERVEAGEPLLELETDKVAMEVTAPATGVVAEILISDGGEAEKGALLGRITVDASAALPTGADVPVAGPSPLATVTNAPRSRSIATFDPALRLSPAVRRLLLETGLDPASIRGTGRGGRLTSTDVEQAAARRAGAPAAPSTPAAATAGAAARPSAAPVAVPAGPLTGRRIPHDTMRRRIAEHMVRSLTTAPHVTAMFEADFSAIIAHREASRAAFVERGVPLTLTAYIVLAVVEAMKAVPIVNSRWHDDFVEVFADVNVGVGAALGDKGLVVPVVHRAQALSLMGVATRLHQATSAARAGTLTPADVQGGTFTISNHGVSGSLTAAPIVINQPQAAILGVGKVEKRVVVREVHGADAILVKPMSYVTLSIDHRVIDGAQTNAWLTRFVQAIETWPAPAGA